MLTRRQFALGSATLLASGRLSLRRLEALPFDTSLPLLQLIDATKSGNEVTLTASTGHHAFVPGKPTLTYGYSAPVLGPVIRVRRGDDVQMRIENALDRATTVHWHGLLVPSEMDGNPHNIIEPGETWRPLLRIDQPASTAWFHPHPHHDTARQIYMGLAGMVIVDDGSDQKLDLPRTYGIDDLPIILQDRLFSSDGSLFYDASPMAIMNGMRGDIVIVNGAIAPVAKVPRGLVRLRLLNAANARNFDLSFRDGRSFFVIASDGGLLPAPVVARQLTISPGERFEIVVDFSNGEAVVLATGPDKHRSLMGGMMRGGVAGFDGPVICFDPTDERSPVTRLPNRLVEPASADPTLAVARRRFVLNAVMGHGMMGMGPGMMGMGQMHGGTRGFQIGDLLGINGRSFDMSRVDIRAKRGTTEIWEVESVDMAHPFHVHGALFRVLSLDGEPPPEHLAGWKDVVLVEGRAEILVAFGQAATPQHPFMFHCHILEHEDAGMMGQYVCA